MRHLFAVLLFCGTGAAFRADPGAPSLPDLRARVKDAREKEAAAKKAREQAEEEYKAAIQKEKDEFDKLFGPGPKPPVPPDPPAPVDPLKAKLKAAFDADTADGAKKRDQAKNLAALYRAAANLSDGADIATSGQLLAKVKEAAVAMVGADALKGVRAAVGAELGALLPTDSDLTADQRKGVADLFTKLATIIEEIAK